MINGLTINCWLQPMLCVNLCQVKTVEIFLWLQKSQSVSHCGQSFFLLNIRYIFLSLWVDSNTANLESALCIYVHHMATMYGCSYVCQSIYNITFACFLLDLDFKCRIKFLIVKLHFSITLRQLSQKHKQQISLLVNKCDKLVGMLL